MSSKKNLQRVRNTLSSIAFAGLATCLLSVSEAHAVTLTDAGATRVGFSFPKGDVSLSSYDGAAFNSFASFTSFVSPDLLKVNAFTGQPLGSQLEFTLLSESAAFDGTTGGVANKFGVKNDAGIFSSILDTQSVGAGATGILAQGANETLSFALQSPEGLFSTEDSDNVDGAAHILAMKVEKAGEYTINPTSLRGTAPLKFNFLEGDLILFIEDMRATGNLTNFLVPANGDFDYNDMVLVVRQNQVPEPMTALLLAFGIPAVNKLRRKRSA